MTDCLLRHDTPRRAAVGYLCTGHSDAVLRHLADLPELWMWARMELQPSQGEGRGSEISLGINVAALDFVTGLDILPDLFSWERVVREDRDLVACTEAATFLSTTNFLRVHHSWIVEQPWVDDYAGDIATAHSTALIASRLHRVRARRIQCPSLLEDDTRCGAHLELDIDPDTKVRCRRCGREWSQRWLLRLLLDSDDTPLFVDTATAAAFGNVTRRRIQQLAASEALRTWERLVELHDVMAAIRPRKAHA